MILRDSFTNHSKVINFIELKFIKGYLTSLLPHKKCSFLPIYLLIILTFLWMGPFPVFSCDRVSYPDWLINVENEKDLEREVLVPDTGTSSKVDAIGNDNFGENDTGANAPEVQPDTMVNRCNTTFGDTGNPNYKHWVFCRAFRLPTGDTYTNLEALNNSPDSSSPDDLVTLTFFHAGNIDDKSEDWLIPFIKKYRNRCMKRPVNVIWMGAYVTKNGDRRITDGNKWHITADKWGDNNKTLFDVSSQSSQVYSGHSTASCPFNDSINPDTRGMYVGGTSESRARRVNARFDTRGLYVGTNSDSTDQCYSGVTDGNPVTASGGGVQFEYNVALGDPDEPLRPDTIAETIVPEMKQEYVTDTPPVSTSVSTEQDTVTMTSDVKENCLSDTTRFFTALTDTGRARVNNYTDSRSASLVEEDFDSSIVSLELETNRRVDTSCLTLSIDLSNWSDTAGIDTATPILYDETAEEWKQLSQLSGDLVISDTLPVISFRPPHFSSFGVSGGVTTSATNSSESTGGACVLTRLSFGQSTLRNLRQVRDYLLHTAPGRLFTYYYYKFFSY